MVRGRSVGGLIAKRRKGAISGNKRLDASPTLVWKYRLATRMKRRSGFVPEEVAEVSLRVTPPGVSENDRYTYLSLLFGGCSLAPCCWKIPEKARRSKEIGTSPRTDFETATW